MFENFPYSNFHDLNTDWIVKKIKDVETSEANAEASAQASAQSAQASAQSATAAAQSAQASAQSAEDSAQSAEASANSATEADNYVSATREQVNLLQSSVDLLQSRVDNIIPSGTQTEGNTELIDIRVAEYGEIYESAGNAVRGQFKQLNDPLDGKYAIVSNNIFNDTVLSTIVYNNKHMYTVDNNNVTINYADGTDYTTIQEGFLNLEAGTYTISVEKSARIQIIYDQALKEDGYVFNKTFTLTEAKSIYIKLLSTQGYPWNCGKVWINKGNTALTYDVFNSETKLIRIENIESEIEDLKNDTPIYQKKIVWFGTSIPAGGYIGADITRNYPSFIADKYGCTIYNESIGSSCAHCKELNMISASNPYGFNPNYTLSSRCLCNTHKEMQWMIDHYNDSFWTNKPTLTELYKTQMMSFSYETKLDKYLTSETFPDLFVFDHGYNDYVTQVDNYTGHEYEPYTLQGALNFLIRRIYSYRPDAKIIIIGNYKYQTRSGLVVQAQETTAQRWDIPIFKNWSTTGLSDEQVYTNFRWVQSGGVWTQEQTTEHLETLTNVLLPDGVHPHSRPDNLIINRMANAIGKWMAENVTFDE